MSSRFVLNSKLGYFNAEGVDVMCFDDIYPAGHQSGVSILMHGKRVATNGDLRLEQTPGQWQPLPKQGERVMDEASNSITTALSYPDKANHLKGFNPMIYPDLELNYTVKVEGKEGCVEVTLDLDRPIPEKYLGKVNFIMELFPGELFGKPWIMDDKQGIFPRQPNGPTLSQKSNYPYTEAVEAEAGIIADRKHLSGDGKGYNPIIADDLIAEPYAIGKCFTVRPDDIYSKFTVESFTPELKLYDGRMNHNNGWFTIASEIPAGATVGAVRWVITPNLVENWTAKPVVQTSQVGYHPQQPKVAFIELDKKDCRRNEAVLYKITAKGEEEVLRKIPTEWGRFLRYDYLKFDFSDIKKEGLYKLCYGDSESSVFRIADDIYERGVWQPVLEYFLPV